MQPLSLNGPGHDLLLVRPLNYEVTPTLVINITAVDRRSQTILPLTVQVSQIVKVPYRSLSRFDKFHVNMLYHKQVVTWTI